MITHDESQEERHCTSEVDVGDVINHDESQEEEDTVHLRLMLVT